MRIFILLLVVFFSCGALRGTANQVLAQVGDTEEKEAFELEQVVVTAPPIKSGPTSTIIDVEKFSTPERRETVLDILSRIGTVHVQRRSLTSPDPEEVIGIRGLDDSRLAIYMDGRPIVSNDTIHDWASQTLDFVEKIEVIRGGASALYGNSLGGVINIVTKKQKKPETLKPHVEMKVDLAEDDTQTYKAHISGGGGPFLYRSSVNRRLSDGYLRNNDFDAWDFHNALTLVIPSGTSLSFSWRYSDLTRGHAVVNDPSRPDYDSSYPVVKEDADILKWHPGRMPFVGGRNELEKEINYFDVVFRQAIWKGDFKLIGYRNEVKLDDYYFAPTFLSAEPVQQVSGGEIYEDQTWGIISQYHFLPHPDHEVTVGFDWRQIGVEPAQNIRNIKSPYIEDVWQVTSKLTTRLGLRYTHLRDSNWWVPPGDRTFYYREWQPKFMASYKFIPETEGYLSICRGFREEGGC